MRHSSKMRPFKQMQADMQRSYSVSDIKKVGRYGTTDGVNEYGSPAPTKYYHISQYAHEAATLRKLRDAAMDAWRRGDTTLYQRYKEEFDNLKKHTFAYGMADDPDVIRAKELKDRQTWQDPTTETYSTPEDNPTNLTPLERSSMDIEKVVNDHRFGRNFATGMTNMINAHISGKDPADDIKRTQAANLAEDMLTAKVLSHNPDKYQPQAVDSGKKKLEQIKNTIDDTIYPVASKEYRREMYPKRVKEEMEAKMGPVGDTSKKVASASFKDMMRSKPNFKSKFTSSIKKIDQSKLQFNGGRKVAAQYSMLPQNHNEYVALDTLNRYDPDLVRDTIGVDFDEIREPFRGIGVDDPKSDEWYKSSGSRYGRRDMQFKQNSYDGGYILDAKKPVDVKWENKSPEIREIVARMKDTMQSDDFMKKIRAKTTLWNDTISDQFHDLNWMNNISRGSKEALGRAADTLQFATYHGDPAYVVGAMGAELRLENGDEWLNDEAGDESVHSHEVRHVANNMVSALDPSYFVLNTQYYPAPVYEGTIPFIKGLWRINDIYGLEDSDEGESLARWIMNARLPRGSKNALFEVLFGAAIIPKLLDGQHTAEDIQEELDHNEVLHDIDEKFMPHNFAYYVNRSGSWEGKDGEFDTANLIHAYVDEIVAGMQQLESNKNINLEFVYPLHDAYFDLTKKVNEHLPDNISNNDRLDLMMAVQTAKNNDRQHYLRTYLPKIRRMLTRNYGVGKSASRKKP